MSFEDLALPFLKADLFVDLTPPQIKTLLICGERTVFRNGYCLIEADQAGDCAYLITSGVARIVDPFTGRFCSETLGLGTLVGELAMLIEIEYATTVVAHGRVEALRFSRETVVELMRHDPSLAASFLSRMTERLAGVGRKLRDFDETLEQATLSTVHASMGGSPLPTVIN